jgi:hypothetical protein
VELYKKYGFEDMLELIEGDFSFLLLDYNINGDESWLYVVKDPFGVYPLYYYENQNNMSKKVQFNIEMKYYGFSSSEYSVNCEYKPFISGHYQRFSHSHKVSAIWKRNNRPILFYKLPFYSVYNDYDTSNTIEYQTKEIRIAIEKRLRWIKYRNNQPLSDEKMKIGVLCLSPIWEKMNMITYLEQKGFDKENEKKKGKTEYVIDHETENEKTRNEFFKLLKIVLIGFVCIFAAIVTFPLIKLLVRTVYGTTGTLTGFVTNAPAKPCDNTWSALPKKTDKP